MKTVRYRDYQAALTALKNQFEEDGINIYDMAGAPEDPIRLGVNWAAAGRFCRRMLQSSATGCWTLRWPQKSSCITAM